MRTFPQLLELLKENVLLGTTFVRIYMFATLHNKRSRYIKTLSSR